MPLTQDEKNAKLLREQIAKIPENKRCADCTAKGPVYANTTFNTFVCTACSGIHREFNHRVKSISMASFKPEEIKGLVEGGNAVARQTWMARWSASDFPEPDPGDPERLRQFIRLKYIDRKWVVSASSQIATGSGTQKKSKLKDGEIPKAEPLTNILGNDIPPIQIRQNVASSPQQGSWASFDNASWNSTAAPKPVSTTQNQPALWDAPASVAVVNQTGLEGLLFPSQDQVQKIEQEKLAKVQEENAKKRSNDLLSQLGSMYQQQAQVNQQQIQQQLLLQQQQMQQQMLMQMAQQGLTPQQQQMYLQQMMMRQMQGQGQIPNQMSGQFSGQMLPQVPNQSAYGTQPVPTPFPPTSSYPIQGFGNSTSPTGFGTTGSVGPTQSPFVESQKLVEPTQPAKPDPFAALSPFSGNASTKFSNPPKKTSGTQQNDLFAGDNSTPAQNNMSDFFGVAQPQQQEVNPFGISQSANIPPAQKPEDFNPFF